MFRLEIILFGLPSTANSHKAHWAIAGKERKRWRAASCLSCLGQNRPPEPLDRAKITCTRYSASEPDFDNLVQSFKSVIDGLKDAKIIKDDKSSVIVERKYMWEKTAPKQGRISILVESVA